jgi:DNA adenine methylase
MGKPTQITGGVNGLAGPVLRWPGSKWRLADWIIQHFPPHDVYLEPYFGSGAVFFNKTPADTETINDLDGHVVNLFRVIRERPEELAALVDMTPWSRQEYNKVKDNKPTGEPLEDARRFLIRCWQGFGSKTAHNSSWAHGRVPNVNKPELWSRLPQRILSITERLKQAQIECIDAEKLIRAYNSPRTLIYADPPYLKNTRRNSGLYRVEMGADDDHLKLLSALKEHKGPVILSGYNSEMYERELIGWDKRSTTARVEKGLAATEVIWINPIAAQSLVTLSYQLNFGEEQ